MPNKTFTYTDYIRIEGEESIGEIKMGYKVIDKVRRAYESKQLSAHKESRLAQLDDDYHSV